MKSFMPDRFALIHTLRQQNHLRTFLARDRFLDREKVVVKILWRPILASERGSLIQQLSWAIGLRHPYFATVFDAGVNRRGHQYFVREYLPVSDFPAVDRVSLMSSLVSAVEFLFRHHSVHGAIKPSNIFAASRTFKLADPKFSSSDIFDQPERIHYVAPEILRGGAATQEADIYSVGAILYRLLVGRHLFEDSDLNSLKSKYLTASAEIPPSLKLSSHPISEIVLQLVNRDPAMRRGAFERLKQVVVPAQISVNSAPFVGHANLLQQATALIETPTPSLKTVLIAGQVGIGKSRFVTELRLRSAFSGVPSVICGSAGLSGENTPIVRNIVNFVETGVELPHKKSGIRCSVATILRDEAPTGTSREDDRPPEKIAAELVSLISSVASQIRMTLTIEDVHLSDPITLAFLRQIAFRSHDLPITMILTTRSAETEPSWINTMMQCLGENFTRIQLPALSGADCDKFGEFLESDPARRTRLTILSGGNPLLFESFAKSGTSSVDAVTATPSAVADVMLAALSENTRPTLEILSVFSGAVDVGILASLCDKDRSDLNVTLDIAARLGLIEKSSRVVEIGIPIVRDKLYSSIPKKRRITLHRKALMELRRSGCTAPELAEHAFRGEIFEDAALLYSDFAAKAYEAHEYRRALDYYERLRRCRKTSAETLTAEETMNLAACYDKVGKRRFSDLLYKELLTSEQVRNNPDLLARVYTGLAMTTRVSSSNERVRFLELAVSCLPEESLYMQRYVRVCNAFLRVGDLSRATEVFANIEKYLARDGEELWVLDSLRATLFFSKGDFRNATKYYLEDLGRCREYSSEEAAVLNNLAFCFENLGDLELAMQYQLRAQKSAVQCGNIFGEILSLNNIAAIKTKRGEVREAEHLLRNARETIRLFNTNNFVARGRLLSTVQADTAMNAILRGEYHQAQQYIKNIRISSDSIFDIDRMLSEIIRWKFFSAIGLATKFREILRSVDGLAIFNTDFVQIERILIQAQFNDVTARRKIEDLQRALTLSEALGTLYQRCEILLSLASVHFDVQDLESANPFAAEAIELARKNGYKILAARTLLVLGLASQDLEEKERYLTEALLHGSEMGLQELIAEAAGHLGMLNLEMGNTLMAREYFIRSTSTTARIAEGVPARARAKYLAKKWRQDAVKGLERCNASIPLSSPPVWSTGADIYFDAIYRFTILAVAAASVEALLNLVERLLIDCIKCSAIITLKDANHFHSSSIGLKITPEILQHLETIGAHAKNRIYFEHGDDKGKQVNVWVPLRSETCEGAIYLTHRLRGPQFTEKEIELLALVGTIASSALKRIEERHPEESKMREESEFYGMIGASKQINEVYSLIRMAAANTATVLVEGESGSGKELVAKAIHAAGPRAKEPFIAVDCGAIPETLIEAELFGAKKGSYTGAVIDRAGLFESAHCGTIFLDEISNTTPALQAKLLRVIQEREVRRIGETKGRPVDVRLIAASNQNLEALSDAGDFRKDLLYRLKVLHIKLPPLRSRSEDIPMLAHAFLRRLNTQYKTKKYFAHGVIANLITHQFPGNIRELQNAIERGFFLTNGIKISEVPLDRHTQSDVDSASEAQIWFKDISDGRTDFWSAIHRRYKRRDISREKVIAFVDFGLRSTKGSYKTMASMFHLKEGEYRRFMDFLRRNNCLLDFRPYRKAAIAAREN